MESVGQTALSFPSVLMYVPTPHWLWDEYLLPNQPAEKKLLELFSPEKKYFTHENNDKGSINFTVNLPHALYNTETDKIHFALEACFWL